MAQPVSATAMPCHHHEKSSFLNSIPVSKSKNQTNKLKNRSLISSGVVLFITAFQLSWWAFWATAPAGNLCLAVVYRNRTRNRSERRLHLLAARGLSRPLTRPPFLLRKPASGWPSSSSTTPPLDPLITHPHPLLLRPAISKILGWHGWGRSSDLTVVAALRVSRRSRRRAAFPDRFAGQWQAGHQHAGTVLPARTKPLLPPGPCLCPAFGRRGARLPTNAVSGNASD